MDSQSVELDSLSMQVVQALVDSGDYSDAGHVVNSLLHRLQRYTLWLEQELAAGENSGPAEPYTVSLLDECEEQALSDIASGDLNIHTSVAPVVELLQA